ncbi:MAG: type I-E CRISPR-associated protein Cse1/CasA [Desulfatirhabdiaceae bacterium]
MNLLTEAWIPVRADGGMGKFRLITYQDLICNELNEENLRISLPRDDLELACLQLLICLTQVIFLPRDEPELRHRFQTPVDPNEFCDRVKNIWHWFDMNHDTHPFMQTRGVKAAESTPIQKLLIGLPEGNNHAFFNEIGEIQRISPGCAAIVLFNQASNCPSFGGGFKGSLRGGAPITTLVMGDSLRETIWRNVITLSLVKEILPDYEPDYNNDKPTWVEPVMKDETIFATRIGLVRGLFWQPAHIELIPSASDGICDLTNQTCSVLYEKFLSEKFRYTLHDAVWPHPHGIMTRNMKNGKLESKFLSFTTTAPAWTQLSEFIIPGMNAETGEGTSPAAPLLQIMKMESAKGLHLIVGGYRNKQAAILERRHELISLAQGWSTNLEYLQRLIQVGIDAKKSLWGKLRYASQGDSKRGIKGIGVPIHDMGEKLFYARTEPVLHEFLQNSMSFKEYKTARKQLAESLRDICQNIFEKITEPYTHKPELVPIIAITRKSMNFELKKLVEGGPSNANKRTSPKRKKT